MVLCISCNNSKKNQKEKSIIKTYLYGSGFSISLPSDYKIEKVEYSDLKKYFFYSTDKTKKKYFDGGFSISANPHMIVFDSITKSKLEAKSVFLGKQVRWDVRLTNEGYYIQTITDFTNKDNSEFKIHAYGHAKTDKGVEMLFRSFETLVYE